MYVVHKESLLKMENGVEKKLWMIEWQINLCNINKNLVKVSYFRKVFWVSSILPKNERKQFDL